MAAPGGYPQHMGPMNPMGGPMGPPMRPPMRRGTSKAVPVVVSAGLAVGVFCGLLFGLGTGNSDAAAPSTGTNVKPQKADDSPATTPAPPKPQTVAKPATPPVTTPTVAANKPTTTPTVPQTPTIKTTKLLINVHPDAAAAVAKIVVDGKEITGNSIDLPVDDKSAKISITAPGYHSEENKKIDLEGDKTSVDIELRKRGGGTSSPGFGGASHPGGNDTPKNPPKPPKKPKGGGLIDI